GNILIYRDLARHLNPGVSVYGLQSVGLDGHKRPLGAVEEMAASYVEEITRQQPEGPYVLAGYCMGGKVALEMARLLEERGQSVGWVGEAPQEGNFIQSVNDRAGFAYVPRSYSGSATLFKPRRTYAAFKDPHMGWREAIKGPVEVVELDMNPHAMLVEPFVQ